MMIKGLLFDYGGTLDTNGRHWASVIWETYQRVQVPISKPDFAKAFVYGERMLGKHQLVKPHHSFLDVMMLKLEQQFDYLEMADKQLNRRCIQDIALICEDVARNTVHLSEVVLSKLQPVYRMVIVSNFYGNLRYILDDFNILHYFHAVVESAEVGVRKPDPQIYRMGVDALGYPAASCVVIGDSYGKDMIPGATIGCKNVWLNVAGWDDSGIDEYDIVDAEINSLTKLSGVLSQLNSYGNA